MTVDELEKADETITKEIKEQGKKYGIPRNNLLWDGVVSAKEYLDPHNKYKIMWMLKETTEDPGTGDYKQGSEPEDPKKREKAKEEMKKILGLKKENGKPKYSTLHGMIYMTYSLLNNKEYKEINKPVTDLEMSGVLKKIAWVNVSKECKGNKETKEYKLKIFYERWKEILIKQIKTYSPDILIFGGTYGLFKEEFKEDWKKYYGALPLENFQGNYFFQGDMLVVPTLHPAYPFQEDASKNIEAYVNEVTRKIKQKMEERIK
jgi:hypothetical protein